MAIEKFVHGNKVVYEKEAEDGFRYLNDKIEREYSKVFFVYAKNYDAAPFEDQNGRKYELSYEKEVYLLTRKAY
jgi:hypothetical protein